MVDVPSRAANRRIDSASGPSASRSAIASSTIRSGVSGAAGTTGGYRRPARPARRPPRPAVRLERLADRVELAGGLPAERGHGHDADHGDEGDHQGVLDEGGTA